MWDLVVVIMVSFRSSLDFGSTTAAFVGVVDVVLFIGFDGCAMVLSSSFVDGVEVAEGGLLADVALAVFFLVVVALLLPLLLPLPLPLLLLRETDR